MSVHLLKCGLRPAMRQVIASTWAASAAVGHRNQFSTRSSHIHSHLQHSTLNSANELVRRREQK